MPKLILQPCGSADSVAHYKDTIENDVHYDQIESFLSDIDKEKLKRIYPDGKLKIWGVTKGKNGKNRGKWDRIEIGDVTLFSAKKRILPLGLQLTNLSIRNWLFIFGIKMTRVKRGN